MLDNVFQLCRHIALELSCLSRFLIKFLFWLVLNALSILHQEWILPCTFQINALSPTVTLKLIYKFHFNSSDKILVIIVTYTPNPYTSRYVEQFWYCVIYFFYHYHKICLWLCHFLFTLINTVNNKNVSFIPTVFSSSNQSYESNVKRVLIICAWLLW